MILFEQISGKRIWLTRPFSQTETLTSMLQRQGVIVYHFALIDLRMQVTKKLSLAIKRIQLYEWVLLASPKAVRFFIEILRINAMKTEGINIACVGQRTAAAIEMFGIRPRFISSMPNMRSLCEELPIKRNEKAAYFGSSPKGNKSALKLIMDKWAEVESFKLYDTIKVKLTPQGVRALNQHPPEIIILTSYSAVDSLLEQKDRFKWSVFDKQIISIGPLTTTYAKENGFKFVLTAKTPSPEGLINAS